jgi:hypothetical protein
MVPGSIGSIQTTIPFRISPPGKLQSRSSGGPAKGPAYPQSTEVLDLQNTQLFIIQSKKSEENLKYSIKFMKIPRYTEFPSDFPMVFPMIFVQHGGKIDGCRGGS